MSDGEFQEGQTWEALAALAYHEIDNVKVVVDVNGQQCDGPMDGVMTISPIVDRARSFGATALEIDGHDLGALVAAANTSHPGGPLVIFAQTDPCRGIEVLRTSETPSPFDCFEAGKTPLSHLVAKQQARP